MAIIDLEKLRVARATKDILKGRDIGEVAAVGITRKDGEYAIKIEFPEDFANIPLVITTKRAIKLRP